MMIAMKKISIQTILMKLELSQKFSSKKLKLPASIVRPTITTIQTQSTNTSSLTTHSGAISPLTSLTLAPSQVS